MIYLLFLVLAYCMAYVEERFVSNQHCGGGYGTISRVCEKWAPVLPNQYRVLFPWFFYYVLRIRTPKHIEDHKIENQYEYFYIIKTILIWFILIVFYNYLLLLNLNAVFVTFILAAFLPVSMINDYTEAFFELIFLGLFFIAILLNWPWYILCILTFVATLNRETAILFPIIYWVFNSFIGEGLLILSCVGIAQSIPRLVYGTKIYRPMPVPIWKKELDELKISYSVLKRRLWFTIQKRYLNDFNVGFLFLISFIILSILGWNLLGSQFNTLIIIFSCFVFVISIFGMINEIRIYYPTVFILIPIGLKLLQ